MPQSVVRHHRRPWAGPVPRESGVSAGIALPSSLAFIASPAACGPCRSRRSSTTSFSPIPLPSELRLAVDHREQLDEHSGKGGETRFPVCRENMDTTKPVHSRVPRKERCYPVFLFKSSLINSWCMTMTSNQTEQPTRVGGPSGQMGNVGQRFILKLTPFTHK